MGRVRVVQDRRLLLRDGVPFAAGGSPWRVVRLAPAALGFLERVRAAGREGLEVTGADGPVASLLIERGMVHPLVTRQPGPHDVRVVVPAHGRPDALRRCLASVSGLDVLVVDDGTPDPSPIAAVAAENACSCERLEPNQGPAAARNAGVMASESDLVAFVDSDCRPQEGWLDLLVGHFDDPRVAVVTPRVVPADGPAGVLARFEATDSALDMGADPALVRPGGRIGFVPSATMLVRRAALAEGGFDDGLRVGEDVDLVWRLAGAGWHVRYEPTVRVVHDDRGSWRDWLTQRFEYGTSAAGLELRHPGRLSPIRVSPWSIASLALAASGHPVTGALLQVAPAGMLFRRLRLQGCPPSLVATLTARTLLSDAIATGHVLRREYWPVGAVVLVASPVSRPARLAAVLMLAPLVYDWARGPRRLDLGRYCALRLLADASYGTGVVAGAWRSRVPGTLKPSLRLRTPQQFSRAGRR